MLVVMRAFSTYVAAHLTLLRCCQCELSPKGLFVRVNNASMEIKKFFVHLDLVFDVEIQFPY